MTCLQKKLLRKKGICVCITKTNPSVTVQIKLPGTLVENNHADCGFLGLPVTQLLLWIPDKSGFYQ